MLYDNVIVAPTTPHIHGNQPHPQARHWQHTTTVPWDAALDLTHIQTNEATDAEALVPVHTYIYLCSVYVLCTSLLMCYTPVA